MEKIGILGSGIVARTLGSGFLKHGYSVMLGSREPKKLADWLSTGGEHAAVGTFDEAAAHGDHLVLAVKGTAALMALEAAGAGNLTGKIVMDTTNPITEAPPQNGVLEYFTGRNESLMETLQGSFPDARFVKAFNSVGSARMVNPSYEVTPTMFICGNDPAAKAGVSAILEAFGWEVQDMGGQEAARAIEPLASLWCIPGFLHNEWTHAFKLLKS